MRITDSLLTELDLLIENFSASNNSVILALDRLNGCQPVNPININNEITQPFLRLN